MGFPELIARSIDEYIDIACHLANSPDKIIDYKNNIRMKFFEVMNGEKFSKEFDELMLETFRNHPSNDVSSGK
jgi:predicted O-linked N-acetylglucosamine transferase (SPINDLY family)